MKPRTGAGLTSATLAEVRLNRDCFALSQRPTTVTLPEAAAWIQRNGTGQRPHTSTLTRWIHRGVRGVKLPAVRAGGGRYMVSLADVATFIERINSRTDELPHAHAIAHELEMRQLDEILGRRPAASQRPGRPASPITGPVARATAG